MATFKDTQELEQLKAKLLALLRAGQVDEGRQVIKNMLNVGLVTDHDLILFLKKEMHLTHVHLRELMKGIAHHDSF